MQTITRSTIVPYTAQQMFDLVNDIEKYPDFLPWCPYAHIHQQQESTMEATVHFAKGPLSHAFTTMNRLVPYHRIDMQLVQGPFRFLEGAWIFEENIKGSKIAFHLSFEWNHSWLKIAVGPFFNYIANSLIDAFTHRAKVIYARD